jgi:hypothetical protein
MPHRCFSDSCFNREVGRRRGQCKGPLHGRSGIMALFRRLPKGYIWRMKQLLHQPVATAAKITLGVALAAAATGLAFASWIDKGAGIFMATVEAGLAWCF